MMKFVELVARDLSHCVTADGECCPITNAFDIFEDETRDWSEAISAVAYSHEAAGFFAFSLRDYEPPTRH